MRKTTRAVLSVAAAAIWISISEFFRNEVLLKSYWVEHYDNLGLVFPSEPVNGAVWGLWSLLFALLIFFISRKFKLLQTTIISWFAGFILMWVVAVNLAVLPYGILFAAIPLSLLEAYLASFIIEKIAPIEK